MPFRTFRGFRSLSLCVLVFFAVFAPMEIQADSRPPNIIFVMVDDLGPEWIQCYGAENIACP